MKLKGVKFGPIYNGVALSDPRLEPVYRVSAKRNNLPLTMHMGTTFARNAPVDMGRAIHVEPVALKYPDLVMVLAHMGHPWYEDAIVVSRKQPNVFCEISALFYRPWQYYNILIVGAGVQDHRQDLLRHRFPVRARRRVGGRAADDQRSARGHRAAAGQRRDDAAHPSKRIPSRTGGMGRARSSLEVNRRAARAPCPCGG